ncbi:MAG: HlyD family secretion protein [Gammaproteobacteria bacterium]
MKKKLLALVGLPLLCGAGAYGVYWAGTLRHLETTDNAYVKADSIVISPKISGYVAEVPVSDNQPVSAGQVLMRIEPSDYQARVEQQLAALQSRSASLLIIDRQKEYQRSQIVQVQASLTAALAQHAKAVQDNLRDQQLVEQGFVTREKTTASRLAVEVAAAGVARARAELAAAHDQLAVSDARLAQMRAELQEGAAASKSVQLELANAILKAPAAGVIGNRTVEIGQYVRAGTQLMTVVPADKIYVVANFKETQMGALRQGQRAKITVDAYPGTELSGTIDSIAPATGSEFSLLPPENAVGNFTKIVQRVPVKIRLAEGAKAPVLRPGMSVSVAIDTRSAAPLQTVAAR